MTIQQLRYVLALEEHGHFIKAAKACSVSQPTLTAQVQKLETELGVTLFDRTSRPIKPTEAGAQLLDEARKVLESTNIIERTAAKLQAGIEGTYEVAIIPTLAPYLLPLFLEPFVKANPSIELKLNELTTDQVLENIKSGKNDVGILVTPIEDPELTFYPLFYEPFLVYLSERHPLLRKKRIARKSLSGQAIWLLSEGHCFREQMLNLCDHDHCALYPNLYYGSGSIETMKRMVSHGKGITLVPELSVLPDDAYARRFSRPEPTREVSLVVKKHFPKRQLVELLSDSISSAVPKSMRERPNSIIDWSNKTDN